MKFETGDLKAESGTGGRWGGGGGRQTADGLRHAAYG